MAKITREQLKALFEQGDRLSAASFVNLIDSLVSTKEDSVISGSLIPEIHEAFDLGSETKAWKEIFVSTGSLNFVDPDGTITSFSKEDLLKTKDIEAKRIADDGIALKRLRAFNSASTFIDLNTTGSARNVTAGTAIDVFVKGNFEALHVSEERLSLGPTNNFPVEITGALDVGANAGTLAHKIAGKVQITGQKVDGGDSGFEVTGSFIKSGSGGKVEFKPEGVSFTDGNVIIEDATIAQAGVINQSINIGTPTSPSIAEYIGVLDNHRITIASGVQVNVHQGSRLIIKQQQPNIIADNATGDITVTAPGGGTDIIFNVGAFGTNPQYIGNNINIPAGNSAGWYGPVHIGKKFAPLTVGSAPIVANTNLGSLRINQGARLRIKDFNE